MVYADKDQLINDFLPEAKSVSQRAAIGRILETASAFADRYCLRQPGYFLPGGSSDGQSGVNVSGFGKIASFRFDDSTDALQTAYVVPAGRQLILTSIILRNSNHDFAAVDENSFFVSRSGNPAGLLPVGAFFGLSPERASQSSLSLSAETGESINFNSTWLVPSAGFNVDLFGYLIDAPGGAAGINAPPGASVKRIRGEGQRFLRLPVHVIGSVTQINAVDLSVYSQFLYESEKNGWLYYELTGNYSGFDLNGDCDFTGDDAHFGFDYRYGRFIADRTYKITARWGYPAIPPPVIEAVRLLTVSIYETVKGTLGQVSVEGFALKPNLIPPDVLLMLDQYKRREFEI